MLAPNRQATAREKEGTDLTTETNFWKTKRLSRRQTLRGAGLGLAGIGAAALIGCGGDEGTDTPGTSTPTGGTGGTSTPLPTQDPNAIQRGGTLRYSSTIDVDTLDALVAQSYKTSYPSGYVYSRMVKNETGDGGPASGAIVGDAAESWEVSDDGLTYTFKMRPGMTWDERAPTSGREMTSEDVIQSWEKFADGSAYRGELVHSVKETAPVESVEAIDDHTVQFNLAFPDGIFLPVLSHPFNFYVHPVESMNGGFNPASDMRGTGPFILDEYRPSIGYKYSRNPNWYGGPDMPYVDAVEELIIPDQAQAESQFRAGNIHFGGVSTQSIPGVLGSVDGAEAITANPGAGGSAISFSYVDGSPFLDDRVRKAISMGIDRDSFVEAVFEPQSLEDAGISLNRYWNTPLSAGFGSYWLDPKGGQFGEHASLLEHNVQEARALLDAAGQSDMNATLIFTPQYGRDWPTRAELFQAMLADIGVNLSLYASDYTTDWIPNYLRAKGNYTAPDGNPAMQMAPHGSRADPGQWLEVFFASFGSNNVAGTQYPDLDEMIREQRLNLDFESRVEQIHNIQRWMVEHGVAAPTGMTIDTVSVKHANVHGPERYQIWGGSYTGYQIGVEAIPYYWLES